MGSTLYFTTASQSFSIKIGAHPGGIPASRQDTDEVVALPWAHADDP